MLYNPNHSQYHLLCEKKNTLKNCKIIARNTCVCVEVIFKFLNVLWYELHLKIGLM